MLRMIELPEPLFYLIILPTSFKSNKVLHFKIILVFVAKARQFSHFYKYFFKFLE